MKSYRMMNWWLDKGVDGFRMDVISLISKDPDFSRTARRELPAMQLLIIVPTGRVFMNICRKCGGRYWTEGIPSQSGKCSGVTLEEALKYASCDGKELSMVFQFEHVDLDFDEKGNKWTDRKCRLTELKEVLSRWQTGLYGRAWNSLFWCNHDQPRVVSRFWGTIHPSTGRFSAQNAGGVSAYDAGYPLIFIRGKSLG